MGVIVFYIKPESYKAAKKVLEENPYEENSFARVGYKLREGKSLGMAKEGYYLYIRSENAAFLEKAKARLADVAELLEGEEAEKVKSAVEEEENAAAKGIGDIFG